MVPPAPQRTVRATVRFEPASITRRADWVEQIAWQGHARVIVAPLRRIGDGIYRTTTPLPAFGSWKTLSWLDANVLRHVAPKGWFYNVMVTGVKPS